MPGGNAVQVFAQIIYAVFPSILAFIRMSREICLTNISILTCLFKQMFVSLNEAYVHSCIITAKMHE